jgi:hypothetical protein
MHSITAKNRIQVAVTGIRNSIEKGPSEFRLETDFWGNVYLKQKGARLCFLMASYSFQEKELMLRDLVQAGFVKHPTAKGLGSRNVWVIPANEVLTQNRKASLARLSRRK